MREKSDASKIRSGRGIITPESYEAWRTAREAKSTGTACVLYDPVQERSVNLLSQAEKKVFWVLRWMSNGAIYEQFPMRKDTVDDLCKELGMRRPSRILSTDFLVEIPGKSYIAVSVKANDRAFCGKHGERQIRRLTLEQAYWGHYGIGHHLIYGDDIDVKYSGNIAAIMKYYPERLVTDRVSMLLHMMAHKVINIPLDGKRIEFRKIADQIKVEELYEDYKRLKDDPGFRGWELSTDSGLSLSGAES